MEQLVILVIIGLISLVNWLMQRSAELREKRKLERKSLGIPEGNPFQEQQPAEETERLDPDPAANMRRLMEALGLPMESEPAPPRKRSEDLPPPLPPPPTAAPSKPAFRPHRTAQVPAAPAPASALSQALKQRGSLRQAIILREILGPPKGLVA